MRSRTWLWCEPCRRTSPTRPPDERAARLSDLAAAAAASQQVTERLVLTEAGMAVDVPEDGPADLIVAHLRLLAERIQAPHDNHDRYQASQTATTAVAWLTHPSGTVRLAAAPLALASAREPPAPCRAGAGSCSE